MTQEDRTHLENLKVHPGWKLLVGVLQLNVDKLAEAILDDIDDTIDPKIKKRLALKRHFQEKLIKLPDNLIKELDNSIQTEEVQFDPFE